jgi:hypothetical protein
VPIGGGGLPYFNLGGPHSTRDTPTPVAPSRGRGPERNVS